MNRGHDDYAPLAARPQVGPGVTGKEERARQQDGQERVPAILVELLEARDVLEAGIRDERVDPAEKLDRRLDGCPVSLARREVGCERLARTIRIGLAVDGEDPPAIRDEALGDRPADPARGTGDERALRRHGPPRTYRTCPLTYEASAEQRKAITPATSSG